MNATRRSVWTVVLLGLAVGCGGETENDAAVPGSTAKTNNPAPDAKGAKAEPPASSGAKPAETKKGDEPPAVEGPKADNALPEGKGAKLTATEISAIKELPAAEQSAAIAQAVCPVSSHHLGSMEKPVKVTAEGRTFYLCCESCEDGLKADPKGVIAKLDKK
jgi:YHS domain-containing protein